MTLKQEKRAYIANLPIGHLSSAHLAAVDSKDVVSTVDVNKLPNGVVTGSNLMQFADDISAEIRSAVALCLLAAQRVAAADAVIQTPDQWIVRHNTVLQNLGWTIDGGGVVNSTFDSVDVAVHKAIIPFLTAAFGAAAAAGALILTALQQLQNMDENQPWITLFDRESRRFKVTEYQFSVVKTEGTDTIVRLASARFNASYGVTQVLFFKIKKEHAHFDSASSTVRANSENLAAMNGDLQVKLAEQAKAYIRDLKL
jgi:hypothetical protein